MNPPRIPALCLVAAVSLLFGAASCSKNDDAAPVAKVTFSASKTRVPLGSPVDLTYTFELKPGQTIDGDYRVFVHVIDAYGNIMPWADLDHDPPVKTSQWKPGAPVKYTRTLFVPVYPYLGEATVEVGLYRDAERLPLQGPDPAEKSPTRSYKVGGLTLLPSDENIRIIYRSGWNPPEVAAGNPLLQWQWTQKSAAFYPSHNPRHDVVLYLEYDANTAAFANQPQQVTVYAGSQAVTTFTADNATPVLRRIEISAAQLGTSEAADLRIEVDRTFVPAKITPGARDTRELGIRIYHLFLENR